MILRLRHSLLGFTVKACLTASAVIASAGPAPAIGTPGKFDYYVLSLSWSPSFCKSGAARPGNAECAADQRGHGFIVHGLWPQYEHGFPQYCATPAKPGKAEIDGILDLMVDPNLVAHEWRAHGSCAGLPAPAYLDEIRKARAKVTVPPVFQNPPHHLKMTPGEIENAFIKANPGLTPGDISIACDDRRLSEVRICMTRSLNFRGCEDVNRRGCQRPDKLAIPTGN